MVEDEEEGEREEQEERDQKQVELLVFLGGGLTQSNTMKLQGWLKRKNVLVLIDSGSNHNFISDKLVAELGLALEESPPYKVCLGDGYRKTTSGCCRDILLQLEGLKVKERFCLFELGGVDLILGVTNLVSLIAFQRWI